MQIILVGLVLNNLVLDIYIFKLASKQIIKYNK